MRLKGEMRLSLEIVKMKGVFDDFEGGKMGFKTGKGVVEYGPTVGRMVIFPSYLLHKVNPVTSGTRWAMVGWAHGASFR